MASLIKLSYQKLQKPPNDDDPQDTEKENIVVFQPRIRFRAGGTTGRKWRRPRTRIRISRLKRLIRRKARVVSAALRFSVAKVVRRFKEGRPYLADLFAGNYMFLQVTPSPTMGPLEKSFVSRNNYYPSNFSTSYAPKLGA